MKANESELDALTIPKQERITSIDAFRALSILMLIFFSVVHDGTFNITNLPAWMWHATPPKGMTIVDVGCPFFIFIIGMCIPIAISRRLNKNKSYTQMWAHILIRTASLMIMGILMGNLWQTRSIARPIGMSINAWGVLLFVSFFLIWNRYPKSQGLKRTVFVSMRTFGIVLLTYLVAIFRIPKGEGLGWLEFGSWGFWSWWILGILGWSYLISCIIYFIFRRHTEGIMACLGLLILIYIGDVAGIFSRFHFLNSIRHYVPFYALLGTWPSISTAGVIVGMLYIDDSPVQTPRKRLIWILSFGAGLFVAGYLLSPLFGISSGEGRATPTWALYCSAISCVVFACFYLLMDIWGKKRWIKFLLPIAANPLLIYLLSRMIHPLFGLLRINFINNYFNSGMAGVLRTIVLCVLLILLTRWLVTRCRVTLRL
ncbi:MAG: DUF5009 domain-containing protein [Planctomycetes bacterium]|nr:DUF5009 domain-containing protein [Planctomycetota bacterium]